MQIVALYLCYIQRTNDNFSELIRKISPIYNFFEFIYHKIPVPIGLDAKVFLIQHEFRNQFIVSAIKFGESLSKFMIPISLLEKFGS